MGRIPGNQGAADGDHSSALHDACRRPEVLFKSLITNEKQVNQGRRRSGVIPQRPAKCGAFRSRTGNLHGRRGRRIVLIKGRNSSRIPEAGPVTAQGQVVRHYANLVQSMNIVSPVFRSVMVLGQLTGAIWLCTFGDWWKAGRYDLLVAMGAMLLILRCQGRWWTAPVPSQKSRIGLGRPEVTGLDGHEFSEGGYPGVAGKSRAGPAGTGLGVGLEKTARQWRRGRGSLAGPGETAAPDAGGRTPPDTSP